MVKNQSSVDHELRIAMLIDGDNAQHSVIKQMIEEVSRYGEVTIRQAYGDWTQPNLANWRPVMLAHAIQPIQQWRYAAGKNATDSALIIDAMDILYSGTVQGFCVVSSDSDYTRLCMRIREAGLFIMGIGRQNTPEAFIKACKVFVFVENLVPPDEVKETVKAPSPDEAKAPASAKPPVEVKAPAAAKTPTVAKVPVQTKASTTAKAPAAAKTSATTKAPSAVKTSTAAKPPATAKTTVVAKTPAAAKAPAAAKTSTTPQMLDLLSRAYDISVQDNDGWVFLGALGDTLRRIEPSFDSRTYGFKSLSLLIKSMPDHFDVKGAKTAGTSTIYVRLKNGS